MTMRIQYVIRFHVGGRPPVRTSPARSASGWRPRPRTGRRTAGSTYQKMPTTRAADTTTCATLRSRGSRQPRPAEAGTAVVAAGSATLAAASAASMPCLLGGGHAASAVSTSSMPWQWTASSVPPANDLWEADRSVVGVSRRSTGGFSLVRARWPVRLRRRRSRRPCSAVAVRSPASDGDRGALGRRRHHRRLVRLPRERAAGRALRPGAAGRRATTCASSSASGRASSCSRRWRTGSSSSCPSTPGTALQFLSLGESRADLGRRGHDDGARRRARRARAGGPRRRRRRRTPTPSSSPARLADRYELDAISDLATGRGRPHLRRPARVPRPPVLPRGASTPCTGSTFARFVPLDVGGPADPPGARRGATSTWRCCSRPTRASPPTTSSCSPTTGPAAGRERHPGRPPSGGRPVGRRAGRRRRRRVGAPDDGRPAARSTREVGGGRRDADGGGRLAGDGGPGMRRGRPSTAPHETRPEGAPDEVPPTEARARARDRPGRPAAAAPEPRPGAEARRRRPTGAPPPLPRSSGDHRQDLAGRAGRLHRLGARRCSSSSEARRATDRADAAVLRRIAEAAHGAG